MQTLRKVKKLLRHPVLFVQDAKKNRSDSLHGKNKGAGDFEKKKIANKVLIKKVSKKTQADQMIPNILNTKDESKDLKVLEKNVLNIKKPEENETVKKTPKNSTEKVKKVEPLLLANDLFVIDFSFDKSVTPDNKYIYLPWIKSHGDKLVSILNVDAKIVEMSIFKDLYKDGQRSKITKFIRDHPDLYRMILLGHLAAIKNKISGVIVTMDWTPSMRQLVYVCKELKIKTILIPHESVFADRNKYYLDIVSGARTPIADKILAWGDLQKDIFIERGYLSQNIEVVGSPKLDKYYNYEPVFDREIYFKLYGLDSSKKTLLFAAQPLDSQFDTSIARESQRQVIRDLFEIAELNNIQVIVRCPPSGDKLLNQELCQKIKSCPLFAKDELPFYSSSPEDSITYCDMVISINSTMLFEACLAKTAAVRTAYVAFDSIWDNLEIPAPKNKQELQKVVLGNVNSQITYSKKGMDWAATNFSNGKFDGGSIGRINSILEAFTCIDYDSYNSNCINSTNIGSLKSNKVISLHNKITELTKHVPEMLGFDSAVCARNLQDACYVDVFVKWGVSESQSKKIQDELSCSLGRPQMIIEDGFIRSKDIGLSGEAALSVIVDDITAYYDATKSSSLEKIINGSYELLANELDRARRCIGLINTYKVSKYNHAPYIENIKIGINENKILLVDQRFGDMSVEKGMANEKTFQNMLLDAVNKNPESDIIIKRHPDATKGGKKSYFCDENLASFKHVPNLYVIDYEINPHALFKYVDEVYVVTSGMGFEAVLAGCKVTTYGLPYYAGWGVTNDKQTLERRRKHRKIEELFYFSYIMQSKYINPFTEKKGEIEDVIAYIANTDRSSLEERSTIKTVAA